MDHKSKKHVLLERQRKFQRINQNALEHQQITDQIIAAAEAARAGSSEPERSEEPIWSEKLQKIKLRNGSRKQRARGMWDRFAGAAGGGGMSR